MQERVARFVDKWVVQSIRPNFVSQNVEWISHHVPKTAGTSLRITFEKAFTEKGVYGIYSETGARNFSKGESIYIPSSTKVLHGHFKPHVNQQTLFPNAKRTVWLRDPIARAWSLLGHTLALKQNNHLYGYIEETYLNKGLDDKEELFYKLLKDPKTKHAFMMYKRYFKSVPLKQFEFVGYVERYEEDLAKFSNIIGVELKQEEKNVRNAKKVMPEFKSSLRAQFDEEYKLYESRL
ncbi:sulfotransferase family 2 domain-containing protein [Psychrosphaera haliotis]|uniref:Sulfotransferase family protein n=1 Tax=Psychrosphaera haliotis TaxID=555083 RepID=A0A6N8F9P6_9GAMM|nr:sulfotransferase family 2 domain-containing protein [Psychrosphaera haliotis]MUH72998.1 hypothetical protein [Psychrosphaera haliotis]